ncbi:C-type lectin domain family 2 member D [Varanus komodoensis]|nr:C-type lectin domain family 2 member D [Varanus komodoensis]
MKSRLGTIGQPNLPPRTVEMRKRERESSLCIVLTSLEESQDCCKEKTLSPLVQHAQIPGSDIRESATIFQRKNGIGPPARIFACHIIPPCLLLVAFVMRFNGKNTAWIGLRREQGQPWKWTNGDNSTLQVIGNGGDCTFLNDEATITSSSCQTKLLWICNKSDTVKS